MVLLACQRLPAAAAAAAFALERTNAHLVYLSGYDLVIWHRLDG